MAFDAFLKLDGIAGDSTDKQYSEWIELESFSWGATQTSTRGGGGAGKGKVEFQDLHFVVNFSKASPELFKRCATGEHIKTGVLAVRQRAEKPVVLVGHSLGVLAIAHAAPLLPSGKVQGAFLVSVPDVERADFVPAIDRAFAPIPRDPLPFPSVLVASRTDPHCEYDKAEDLAYTWGSAFVDAGDAGHLNTESGHGPWPEGLMRFAGFLKRLG